MSHETAVADVLPKIIQAYRRDPSYLLQMLREIQNALNWVPPAAIKGLSTELGIPYARIRGVAGFYSFLHMEPVGQYRVLFSDNITDRMLGNEALLQRFCKKLWVEPGKVSEDQLLSVDRTSCTGLCDQGPAMLVNGYAISRLSVERIDAISDLIRAKTPISEWPRAFFAVDDNICRSDDLLSGEWASGDAVREVVARGADAMLAELKLSRLRGCGGAGFSTHVKWESARNAQGQARYVVCNADEGEPGTFKDRVLLSTYADLVFDGMTVAGYTIGAKKGLLYLRGEYLYLLPALQTILERRRRTGLLGVAVAGAAGFDFDIEIHLGAGAYVCGEESALIESLEGNRGVPRIRPPFPVTHGYLGQPTVVNNVETLARAALVAIKGGDWYASKGTPKSAGTKLLSISGDVERPGIYEYPFGTPVSEVLRDCGGEDAQAVQVSGPSGRCIAMYEFGHKIAFEDIPTAGAFMVFGKHRDMFEVARNFVHFFAHESCGFCTPCRVGTSLAARCMDKIADGHGTQNEIGELANLHHVLRNTCHCGLGQSACNAVMDTLHRFRPSYERRLQSLDFEPSFDLDDALAPARQMTGRDDAAAHLGDER